LALAGVARLAEIAADIGAALAPCPTPKSTQRDPFLLFRHPLSRLLEERASLIVSDDEGKRRNVQVVQQRIAELQESLTTAEVVPLPDTPTDRVTFGATVTVRERDGEESRYRIVGVDEADGERGSVSWLSPIARALLNARLGEHVRFKFPAGETVLEIVGITYE
jgi:transcription elongation factor GreB